MKVKYSLLLTTGMAALLLTAPTALAQPDGGGERRFRDPEEMRQRMMQNFRDEMSVTNDQEWQIIQTRVQKVMDARRDMGPPAGFGRMFGRRARDGGNDGPPGPRRGGFGGPPSAELEALNKAIDSNAPAEQVKAAMQRYRDWRQAKEAALEKAQTDLKEVLSVKQEAVALSHGLIN